MKKQLILICRKCGHRLYVSKWDRELKIKKTLEGDCPDCGEEGFENWILGGFGNYDKDLESGKIYKSHKNN